MDSHSAWGPIYRMQSMLRHMVAKTPALDTDITTTAMTETYAETFHRWRRNVKQGLRRLEYFLEELRDATKTTLPETEAETHVRWLGYITRGVSYLFLYGYPHVSTDFFAIDFEAPDYIWFMIIFMRMVLFLIRLFPLRVSRERRNRMGTPASKVLHGLNWCLLLGSFGLWMWAIWKYYWGMNPTVNDLFAIVRSVICSGYS